MDMKPKSLFRYVVERAKAELAKRVTPDAAHEPVARAQQEGVVEPSEEQPPAKGQGATLACERVSPVLVRARWDVEPAQHERLERMLEVSGELSVRCVAFYVDAGGAARREVIERAAVEPRGTIEWAVQAEARCVVSVGLAGGDAFVAIAHDECRSVGS